MTSEMSAVQKITLERYSDNDHVSASYRNLFEMPGRPTVSEVYFLDGVPAFVSEVIHERCKASKRRRRSPTTTSLPQKELRSPPSGGSQGQPNRFLDLPKDHPLYWDKKELLPEDFPESERDFLLDALLFPQNCQLSRLARTMVEKMHNNDWNMKVIGRTTGVLFHPDSNLLHLSPHVASYFFKRINSLKTDYEQAGQWMYRGSRYDEKNDDLQLAAVLRRDFLDATRRYAMYLDILR